MLEFNRSSDQRGFQLTFNQTPVWICIPALYDLVTFVTAISNHLTTHWDPDRRMLLFRIRH